MMNFLNELVQINEAKMSGITGTIVELSKDSCFKTLELEDMRTISFVTKRGDIGTVYQREGEHELSVTLQGKKTDLTPVLFDNPRSVCKFLNSLNKSWYKENDLSESTKLTERYNESAEFEEDVSNISDFLKKSQKILESKNWKEWMQESNSNYGTDSVNRSKRVLDNLKKTIKELDDLYEELVDAS